MARIMEWPHFRRHCSLLLIFNISITFSFFQPRYLKTYIGDPSFAVIYYSSRANKMAPSGPYRLVTVNTAPERAKRLIGRVVEDVKDTYTLIHVANAERIEDLRKTVEEAKPDLLFTASMWTPEEAAQIVAIAKEVIPNLRTYSLPQGLQVQKGPDAVVEFIEEHLGEILGAN
ncbi:hypothetical protein V8F20_011872 [Naviculisporaceae sp. PSN 640]